MASAEISGEITDPSGSAVANASVTATQAETNVIRSTVSGVNGSYVMPNLPIGPYTLSVTANGFATYVQKGIVLSVGDNVTISVALVVGSVKQQILAHLDRS